MRPLFAPLNERAQAGERPSTRGFGDGGSGRGRGDDGRAGEDDEQRERRRRRQMMAELDGDIEREHRAVTARRAASRGGSSGSVAAASGASCVTGSSGVPLLSQRRDKKNRGRSSSL